MEGVGEGVTVLRSNSRAFNLIRRLKPAANLGSHGPTARASLVWWSWRGLNHAPSSVRASNLSHRRLLKGPSPLASPHEGGSPPSKPPVAGSLFQFWWSWRG